jgi:hypothetical protein
MNGTCSCEVDETHRLTTCQECGTVCCRGCALEVGSTVYCAWCAIALPRAQAA